MASKILTFIKVVLLGVSLLATAIAVLMPYWFKVDVEVYYGNVKGERTLDIGLFFMDKGGINMIDMVFQSEAINEKIVPNLVRVAQVFFFVGSSGLFVCFIASIISLLRKYRSVAGEICLAAALLPTSFMWKIITNSADPYEMSRYTSSGSTLLVNIGLSVLMVAPSMCLLLGVVFAALSVVIDNGDGWNNLPNPGMYVLIDPKADVSLSYAVAIGAIAALTAIAGAVISWMEACSICREVETARYQMLRAPINDEGTRPGPGGGRQGRKEVEF